MRRCTEPSRKSTIDAAAGCTTMSKMNDTALAEARFWDRKAEGYAKSPIADLPAYEKKLLVTREHLRPDMKLLEVGCGTGTTALIHAPHVAHIRATDLSSQMIAIAKKKAADEGIDNVTFEQASIASLEAEDGAYDAILAMSILHLLEDRRGALEKLHRLLAPGGKLFTSTPCLSDGMAWVGWIAPFARLLGFFPYVECFSEQTLMDDLAATGFEVDYKWKPGPKKALFTIARRA